MSRANEAAFPAPHFEGPNGIEWGAPGLTIREHFALEIFKSYIAGGLAYGNWDSARDAAVGQAGALIAELAKVQP